MISAAFSAFERGAEPLTKPDKNIPLAVNCFLVFYFIELIILRKIKQNLQFCY